MDFLFNFNWLGKQDLNLYSRSQIMPLTFSATKQYHSNSLISLNIHLREFMNHWEEKRPFFGIFFSEIFRKPLPDFVALHDEMPWIAPAGQELRQ